MKRILTAAGLAAMTLAAVPASAQGWRNTDYGNGYGRGDYEGRYASGRGSSLCDGSRAASLRGWVRQERLQGGISRTEALYLRRDINIAAQNAAGACSNGLRQWEARAVDASFDQLERRIRGHTQYGYSGRSADWNRYAGWNGDGGR